MDPKVSNKSMWSFYYFSKNPAKFYNFWTPFESPNLAKPLCFIFSQKSSNPGGVFCKIFFVFYLST
jgi:hypothetical protein